MNLSFNSILWQGEFAKKEGHSRMRPGNLKNHKVLTTKFSPHSYRNVLNPIFLRLATADWLIVKSGLIRMNDVRAEAISQQKKETS